MHCKTYSHFFSKKFQHICVSLVVNFNESLTNDIVSLEHWALKLSNNIWATSWQDQQNIICAQRSLRSAWASAQSDQSLRCALNDSSFLHVDMTLLGLLGRKTSTPNSLLLHADSQNSDQNAWMPRLIWVFAWRTSILLVLSSGGSFH